jgi:hypothetical protein
VVFAQQRLDESSQNSSILLSDKMIDFISRAPKAHHRADIDNAAYAKYREHTIAKVETIYSNCHSSFLFLAHVKYGVNGKDKLLVIRA